ncbi:MAG: hypothetical protein HY706_16065 [Candidatus Hydrogenedentes bacterium]|nr:hypothetical protein [Candidatus Hydrogenedentota bacterium]
MMTTVATVIAFSMLAAESKGTLKVGDETIPLTHVYALQRDNEEGALDAPELRLLFADREIALTLLEPPVLSRLDAMAREKKLQGVLLRFDPKQSPREVHGTVYHAPANPQESMAFFTLSGEEAGFKSLEVNEGKISGDAVYEEGEAGSESDVPKFSYRVTFTAPVQKPTPLSASLKGAEAVKSPQAQAYLAYQDAVRKVDFQAAKASSTAEKFKALEEFVQLVGKDAFAEQAKQFVPERAIQEKRITGVYVRGTNATLIVKDETGMQIVTLVEDGGTWKAD